VPQFRADYNVKSSIVLPKGSEPLILMVQEPTAQIIIQDAEPDTEGHVPELDIRVISNSDSIESVPNAFRKILAEQLDILTFVTHETFSIKQCYRVMEWEPNQKKRVFKAFQQFDPLYPPKPELIAEFGKTAQYLMKLTLEGYVSRALRYFRYGILADQSEDQFQSFWLALETIAEGSKDGTKIPIPCPKCQGPVKCEACNDTPMRRPMARQAIKALIKSIVTPNPDEVYKDVTTVRDSLLHGRSVESIEKEIGRPLTDLLNAMGSIAWRAIIDSMPPIKEKLTFSQSSTFVNGVIIAGPTGTFDHLGDGEHPTDNQIPKVKVEMKHHYGRTPPQG
jgi:hypothetical protein